VSDWTAKELDRIGAADELEIAFRAVLRRPEGCIRAGGLTRDVNLRLVVR
jgi:hypothetical protein